MPRYIENEIAGLIDGGIDPGMVCAVLAYTGGAPRPSWAYARAVIEKQAAMGARTAEDFHGNVSSWRQKRTAAPEQGAPVKRVIEQRYEQRTYAPGTLDDIPEELLREVRR